MKLEQHLFASRSLAVRLFASCLQCLPFLEFLLQSFVKPFLEPSFLLFFLLSACLRGPPLLGRSWLDYAWPARLALLKLAPMSDCLAWNPLIGLPTSLVLLERGYLVISSEIFSGIFPKTFMDLFLHPHLVLCYPSLHCSSVVVLARLVVGGFFVGWL